MTTDIKGDPESRRTFVRSALDQAFTNRILWLFNDLCNDLEGLNSTRIFVDRFKSATDQWNVATAALDAEYAPPAP